MMKAVQHCQPSFPANALWPQTNLQPGIIHVSHSLIAGTTFKSASLIRSWTTGDTCIHFANKSPPPPLSSDISTVVQLCGLWKKMAAHPRARYAQQILLVSRPCFLSFFLFLNAAPFLVSKVSFTRECGSCCSCPARLSKQYRWLRARCVTDWWCCWNPALIFYRLMQPVRD